MSCIAERYHDISCGHRVHNQGSKCELLHGHNYRVHYACEAVGGDLDTVGRVIDFSDIKSKLCMWLEDNWDHKFLAWEQDPIMQAVWAATDKDGGSALAGVTTIEESIVWVPFNPTAENMAQHLVEVVGPQQLADTGIRLAYVRIEETRKCSATFIAEA
jgi:6-pyruvoyltetrahydropterin/6-carboxytetrahydropterin synthase